MELLSRTYNVPLRCAIHGCMQGLTNFYYVELQIGSYFRESRKWVISSSETLTIALFRSNRMN